MEMILELFHPLIRQILEKKKSYRRYMKSMLRDLYRSISLVNGQNKYCHFGLPSEPSQK